MSDRNVESRSRQRRRGIKRRGQELAAVDFFNALNDPGLLDEVESCLPEYRERKYPPTVTLSMFVKQVLEEDGSCQKAVNDWAMQRAVDGLSAGSTNTSAYSNARKRLPGEAVQVLMRTIGQQPCGLAPDEWRWRGRPVKLIDGTGISMPDTLGNQHRYPQPSTQAKGVGFPLARLVAVISLATGTVLDAVMGPHAGKGNSELGLFRDLLHTLKVGDILLADALYCSYFVIASLRAMGVDVVFEQNGSRITDFRRGQFLGTRDHRVSWTKPPTRPEWMTLEQYQAFPDELTVREVKVGGKILVTTMLDHRKVSKGELLTLYGQRWN